MDTRPRPYLKHEQRLFKRAGDVCRATGKPISKALVVIEEGREKPNPFGPKAMPVTVRMMIATAKLRPTVLLRLANPAGSSNVAHADESERCAMIARTARRLPGRRHAARRSSSVTVRRQKGTRVSSLLGHPTGNYQFLPLPADPRILGGPPFSSGVKALLGYEIVRTTFQTPLPFSAGFVAAAQQLAAVGRPRTALCAVEIRVPPPLTVDEFAAFNADYRAILQEWGVYVDGHNPIARSNVAPAGQLAADILLYGFSYTVPAPLAASTYFLSAAPEASTVRPGETTTDAVREKVASAMARMHSGLAAIAMDWSTVTTLSLYTHHDVHAILESDLLRPLGESGIHGIHWYVGPPPIVGIEVEIDVRAVYQERRI